MRRRARFVSDAERRLWRAAMHDATPLPGRDLSDPQERCETPPDNKPVLEKQVAGKSNRRPKAAPQPPHTPLIPLAKPKLVAGKQSPAARELDRSRPVDIDRRSWQKIRRGDVRIDGKIDLHGLTQMEAHERLDGFLMAMQAKGARCVLIITGVGRGDAKGVLKRMVPRWLNEPVNRQRIVTFTQAQLRHGGEGALYVLLKRLRPKGSR